MTPIAQLFLAFAAVLATAACDHPVPPAGNAIVSEGVVRFIDLEGGCWLIESPGERVQPIDLPREFRIDGLRVEFSVRDAPDVVTACQLGMPKYLSSIRRR